MRAELSNCKQIASGLPGIPPRRQIVHPLDQHGFTMIELVVTMALFTVLLAMSVGALSYYLAGRAVDTAARDVATEMREAQEMAVTTGNTYRIDFSGGTTYQLQARQNGTWVNVRGAQTLPGGVSFSTSTPPTFGGDANLDCLARGSCETGTVVVSGNYGKSKSIYIEGETANIRIG